MKHITKGQSPEAFEQWKAQEKPTSWGALGSAMPEDRREEGVHYYSRGELRTVLHTEQNGICAYCNVTTADDRHSPIDHVEPREGDTQTERIFDYDNLVLSCPGGKRSKTKPRKLHCDPGKHDNLIPISPLNPNCETDIQYAVTGKIIVEEQPAAVAETVRVLNLNLSKIVNGRKAEIDAYVWADAEQTVPISLEEASKLLADFTSIEQLSPGQGRSYASAVKSVLLKLTA